MPKAKPLRYTFRAAPKPLDTHHYHVAVPISPSKVWFLPQAEITRRTGGSVRRPRSQCSRNPPPAGSPKLSTQSSDAGTHHQAVPMPAWQPPAPPPLNKGGPRASPPALTQGAVTSLSHHGRQARPHPQGGHGQHARRSAQHPRAHRRHHRPCPGGQGVGRLPHVSCGSGSGRKELGDACAAPRDGARLCTPLSACGRGCMRSLRTPPASLQAPPLPLPITGRRPDPPSNPCILRAGGASRWSPPATTWSAPSPRRPRTWACLRCRWRSRPMPRQRRAVRWPPWPRWGWGQGVVERWVGWAMARKWRAPVSDRLHAKPCPQGDGASKLPEVGGHSPPWAVTMLPLTPGANPVPRWKLQPLQPPPLVRAAGWAGPAHRLPWCHSMGGGGSPPALLPLPARS